MVLKLNPSVYGRNSIQTRGPQRSPSASAGAKSQATSELPANLIALPRRNDSLQKEEAPTPKTLAQFISALIRNHQKPVMAVMTGAMALPMLAGVAQAQVREAPSSEGAPDVGTVERAPVSLSETDVDETFDPAALKNYPLFKLFWDSGDPTDGLSHNGLDEVTPQGVEKLLEYARTHNLDGTVSPEGNRTITKAERDLVKSLLEHDHYGAFFELDALPAIYSGFGIEANTVHSVAVAHHAAIAALAKALGTSESSLKLDFPNAGPTAETTYFSMDGAMAKPMSYVDLYREAMGAEKKAEAYEKAPVLGWMMDGISGHTKHGSFDEKRPFSTSGLNWGTLLFPGDKDVETLPVKSGFDFPIDALTGFNRAVGGFASRGDHIVVVDKSGNELTATKVIHKDSDGKPSSWSAVFKNAAGEEVKASDVLGLIKDRYGNLKGDGKAVGTMDMGWWGFCDRNTAEKLYKSKFNIPNIDREVVRVEVNGKIIEIPKADAQKLLDVDVTDIVGRPSFVGARFDDEPSTITLLNGSTINGKIKGYELRFGPNARRAWGDEVLITNRTENPLLGSIELKGSYNNEVINLEEVESITKKADGQVEVRMTGNSYARTGKLLTNLSFANAEETDAGLVLRNTKANPILGEFVVDLGAGETQKVSAADVKSISGELQTEMSISDYVSWVMKNEGMFATDASKGVVVSNGMRWVNKLDVRLHEGAENPEWASGELHGTAGKLVRQDGDKLLLVDALYKTEYSSGLNTNFKGWIQLGASGEIINEGFLSGEPDFGWAAMGPIDWNAKSSFNPHMVPEIRLKLLVNGIEDMSKLESMAERLNFPSNWRDLRVEAPTTTTTNSTPGVQ